MKRRKLKLKEWVKDALVVITIVIAIFTILVIAVPSLTKTARECDKYYNHTCSIYEIDQFGKGIRR